MSNEKNPYVYTENLSCNNWLKSLDVKCKRKKNVGCSNRFYSRLTFKIMDVRNPACSEAKSWIFQSPANMEGIYSNWQVTLTINSSAAGPGQTLAYKSASAKLLNYWWLHTWF